jgi:hypothetical protein
MRRVPVTVLTFVVLMLLPPAATAASGADPSNPSLDQYVESVPSADGGPPRTAGSSQGHLSDSVRHRLATQGGSDAAQLAAVASSPALGAPSGSQVRARRSGRANGPAGENPGARPPVATRRAAPSGLRALATAATHGEGSSIGVLLAGLLAITALAGGTALTRRRNAAA